MKLNISNKFEEPLLARHKITASVEFEKAIPSRNEVINEISKKIDAKPELTVVSSITPSFGARKADVTAYAYKTKEDMMKALAQKIIAKTGLQVKKAAAEAKAEIKTAEIKEQKPAKVEQKPAEAKPEAKK